MTNPRICFIAFVVSLAISSCDPGVQYRRIIQNNSSYDLKVFVFGGKGFDCKYQYVGDSLTARAKSEATLASYSGLGQTIEFNNCESCADSIVIRIVGNNTLRTTIDFNSSTAWTFTTSKTSFKSGGTCECRLLITDNDIR